MIKHKKRPVIVYGKSAITCFLVMTTNESSLSNSAISSSASVDVASNPETIKQAIQAACQWVRQ
ncbi:hypothetical protein DPMN_038603 [Dreissena polymorpha]|uniref:Uncharacterized protein n=1 Tax=Dreissena polymorpha TaxID=45954 RepID=A0A9D4RQU7_DREPO|nr:hypothetical protein DPMN_038603 [Dreissena polymorpha]